MREGNTYGRADKRRRTVQGDISSAIQTAQGITLDPSQKMRVARWVTAGLTVTNEGETIGSAGAASDDTHADVKRGDGRGGWMGW